MLKHGRRPVNAEIQSDDNGITEEELTNMRDSSSEDVKAAGPELGLQRNHLYKATQQSGKHMALHK